MRYRLLSALLLASICCFSQKGRISGKVLNSRNGEPLIGATVTIDQTGKTTKTDLKGNYYFNSIDSGEYSLLCTYVSFSPARITDIKLQWNQSISQDMVMNPAGDMSNVVVNSKPKAVKAGESVNSLLIAQKNSSNVSDGISAESIKRTPDRNTSDILKRVTGVSIQNDRFVIVRGLNDRYNASYLNGTQLPSTESDRKAFSFDIFPANILDNLIIVKTATPDIPAEFAGGSVFINSKDIVSENFQSLSIGAGYNTITTFRNFKTYTGGKLDFMGFDDGTRALPSYIPSTRDFPQPAALQPYLAKSWNNRWFVYDSKALPNLNLQYVLGRNFRRKGNDFMDMLVSLTYSRNQTNSFGVNREHQEAAIGDTSGVKTQFKQDYYTENVLVGALANFSFKFNRRNQLSMKNLLSLNAQDQVIAREGYADLSESDPLFSTGKTLWYTSNRILSSQLLGDHYMARTKIRINWMASNSAINREVPDLRTIIYTKLNSETDLRASVSDNATTNGNGGSIYYSKLQENSQNLKIDIQRNFKISKSISSLFKAGIFYQQRNRSYGQRNLGLVKGNVGDTFFNYSLLYLPEAFIFSTPNIGSGKFILAEDKNPTNNYTARTGLTAGYLLADQRFGKFLRMIYGVRIEKFDLKMNLPRDGAFEDTVNRVVTDMLPSGSAIFSLNSRQNIRLAYSRTLNRPEFRELAPAKFYDFATRYVTNGDTSIKRALIDNFDLRYEIYPGKGQVITISAFYKRFYNPIEQATAPDKDHEAVYFNVVGAMNKGIEIEERLELGDLLKEIPEKSFLSKLTLFSNVALIKSTVTARKSTDTSKLIQDRPLQGQSQFSFNGGITYNNERNGISATLAANRVGQRIFLVGNIKEADIWENGRTVIDLQLSKKLSKKNIEIKLNVKDLLAQRSVFFEDTDNNKKYIAGKDYVRWYKTFGQTISLTATWKL